MSSRGEHEGSHPDVEDGFERAERDSPGLWLESALSIDPRTLGLTRILIASLLLIDLGKRAVVIATWYSNSGLLPNHTLLWRPGRSWQMSFLWTFSYWQEAAVAFALIALVYLALLVGYRTRLAQILALVCLISLHVRVDILCNGGDFVFCALLWWTVFLPLGRRFSVDAVRRSLRGAERSPQALHAFSSHPRDTGQVRSLAVLALAMQLALIYFLNAYQKQGVTWTDGTAIHYLLQQERILTPLGLWARHHVPFVFTQALSYATLVIEAVLPLLILSPYARPWTRRLAILLIFGLHTSIALVANLGMFSPVMCVFGTLLLTRTDWDSFIAWAGRRRQRTVYYDETSGVVFALARSVARLDVFSRLDLRSISEVRRDSSSPDPDSPPPDTTLLVVDPESGRRFVGTVAVGEVLKCLPLGSLFGWLLTAPGVGTLADPLYQAASARRTRISRYFGWSASDVAASKAPPVAAIPVPASDAGRLWAGARTGLREATVLFLIIIATTQALHENSYIPEPLRLRQIPTWVEACVSYTRLYQGWKMFARDAPTTERDLVVVAETVDGRQIDPVRAAASRSDIPHPMGVAVQPGYDVYWTSYAHRIEGRGGYHGPLRDWIMAHALRTGNPDDRITRFAAYIVEQDSPVPGGSGPSNVRTRRFLKGP